LIPDLSVAWIELFWNRWAENLPLAQRTISVVHEQAHLRCPILYHFVTDVGVTLLLRPANSQILLRRSYRDDR
jgi:hypothetical protein